MDEITTIQDAEAIFLEVASEIDRLSRNCVSDEHRSQAMFFCNKCLTTCEALKRDFADPGIMVECAYSILKEYNLWANDI